MTKSNWRDELYLDEVAGTVGKTVTRKIVRQGIKVGGKRGGRAAQGAVAAGKTATQHAMQKKEAGRGEKIGKVVGGVAGGIAGGALGTPLGGVGAIGTGIAGGEVGERVGGAIGKKFDKKKVGITTAVKKEETLLYDVVHDYIITENFASDTEGANKIMLKLSDELMQEIYERTMTASEKRKDTMLKKKYDDSDMKKNMQAQYGKEEGKKVYFATIRKQAMKKEQVEVVGEGAEKSYYIDKEAEKRGMEREARKAQNKAAAKERAAQKRRSERNQLRRQGQYGAQGKYYVTKHMEREDVNSTVEQEVQALDELSKSTLLGYVQKGTRDIATRSNDASIKGMAGKRKEADKGYEKVAKRVAGVNKAAGKLATEEVVDEAKYEAGASTYGKATIRNKRKFGTSGELPDIMTGKKITKDATRGELINKRREEHKAKRGVKEEVGITTHSMMMKDKAKKEAMLRMKERDAVAKKLRKEERDEYGDPVGGPKISKKEKEKNLKKNTPDEQHTTTTSEGYGSDRVGPALTMARAIDKVNPRPKPNSKRTRVSRALKMASIKKDEKIRKRKENPYSTDKKLKMVATSIRDRVKRKVKSMAASENYIPEEGYDIARDMGRVKPSKDKKDGTTMPPSAEMKKTQKVNKGPSAFDRVKKKYGKAVMVVGKK